MRLTNAQLRVIHTTQGELRAYHAWILAREAPDVEGAWYAHCPEFDVLSQGADPFGAIELAQEAVLATIRDDVEQGHDPASRRTPDDDDTWISIACTLAEGVRCDPPREYEPETERPAREIAKSIVILHDRAKGECSVKIENYLIRLSPS
jgi:predicted RNase H-like HicB family nuclease